MTGVTLTYFPIYLLLTYILIENYLAVFITNLTQTVVIDDNRPFSPHLRKFFIKNINIVTLSKTTHTHYKLSAWILFWSLFTLKTTTLSILNIWHAFYIFIYVIIALWFVKFAEFKQVLKGEIISLEQLVFAIIFIFLSFSYVDNLITFALIIELMATVYYFFFLDHYLINSSNVLKYKNLLSNYLWLSFFTLFFLLLALVNLTFYCGTLNINELSLCSLTYSGWGGLFLLISILWKISAPGFHFFKLELYQFLSFYSIFFFSLITLATNMYILSILLVMLNSFFTPFTLTIFIIMTLFTIFIFIRGINNLYVSEYFAISSLATATTILFFLFISATKFNKV